jgi:hypothetical protein
MKNIALEKNNKLNKLYVSADVVGAHINPVETHKNYIWRSERKVTCHDFFSTAKLFFMKHFDV